MLLRCPFVHGDLLADQRRARRRSPLRSCLILLLLASLLCLENLCLEHMRLKRAAASLRQRVAELARREASLRAELARREASLRLQAQAVRQGLGPPRVVVRLR